MYKELTIENIKTFEKEQKLKLRPITLLYGENSSGKTTLLKTFDIVHNIFAEYQVKRGKNISESFNSITILVTPWEKGFKCGIITTDDMFEMTDEQYELCTTIAKGMCYAANQNPDKIFKLGIKASLEQKKHEKEPKKHEKNKKDNVIDFLSYLKKKRGEEEQFEEEIKDPF